MFTPLKTASALLRESVCLRPGLPGPRGLAGWPGSRWGARKRWRALLGVFQELCLYTLGNLVVESEAVRKQLLPQGIIPVLASCIQVSEIVQPRSSPALP